MEMANMEIMRDNRNAGRALHAQRRGLTLLDILAAIFVIAVPLITFDIVATHFGKPAGIVAGFLSGGASLSVVSAWSFCSYRSFQNELRLLSAKYPWVYRVTALPTDTSSLWTAEGASNLWTAEGAKIIEVGDYGWEAEPIHDDGLTYLQGLTEKWGVVWYAGFRSDQIERVGRKPRSQYYLPASWYHAGPEAFPCPFPVQSHQTTDLGMPVRVKWLRASKRMAASCKQTNGLTNYGNRLEREKVSACAGAKPEESRE
jgi:hypothetical protein